ncbi:hypothetical protein KY325_05070, partial [Candidatus Woesearchaeota archaeon]|nr:hypothetical protein [Candidatus Woesearchaeota archaeon]
MADLHKEVMNELMGIDSSKDPNRAAKVLIKFLQRANSEKAVAPSLGHILAGHVGRLIDACGQTPKRIQAKIGADYPILMNSYFQFFKKVFPDFN